MDQWTLQMGYPVITIKRNENTDSIIGISQDRFVYDLDKDPGLRNNRYFTFSSIHTIFYNCFNTTAREGQISS